MTNSECIALASVVVIVAGWFFNSWLDRRNEIAKERLKQRMEILLPILNVFIAAQKQITTSAHQVINKQEFVSILLEALTTLSFLGKADEQELCNMLFQKLSKGEPIGAELNQLTSVVCNRIKIELKM